MSFAVLGLAFLPVAARADTFNFSAIGGGFSASGTLVATNNGNGSYTITGVTGNGISGPSSDMFGTGTDNQLYPGAARMLDVAGFNFTDVIGGVPYLVNLYDNGSANGFGYYADQYGPGGNTFAESTVNFTLTPAVAATPEPSGVLLLGTGLMALAAAGLGRRLLS